MNDTKSIAILYVEDDRIDSLAFERLVREHNLPYTYDIADSIEYAQKCIASKHYDILIIDYRLRDGIAFDLMDKDSPMAYLILTGLGDELIASESIKLGAFDYIIKDSAGKYLKRLPSTIEAAVLSKTADLEFMEYHDEIENLVAVRTKQLRSEIEARKRIEKELHRMNYELEQKITQRTLALNRSHEELQKFRNQLIHSNKNIAIHRLLHNLTYQMTAPMTISQNHAASLVTLSETYLDQLNDPNNTIERHKTFGNRIRQLGSELDTALQSIDALLADYHRFVGEKLKRTPTQVNLKKTVEEIMDLLVSTLAENNCTVSLDIPEDLNIYINMAFIQEVLFNLLLHTLNHLRGATKIHLAINAEINDQLKIEYIDNLDTIPKETIADVFTPTYALNFDKKTSYIELNTVYILTANILNGNVYHSNCTGQGNCITLILPVEEPA